MRSIQRSTVALTTDASGDVTGYTDEFDGHLDRIRFVLPGAGGFDNTADLTITEEDTGLALLTKSNVGASFTSYPRAPTNDAVDAASLYAAGGEPVETPYPVKGRIKIVVAQGGNAKAGTFIVDVT